MCQRIRWTTHSFSTPIQDVRIDHRRAHIPMAKQLLDRPDVVSVLPQAGGDGMAECMARGRLRWRQWGRGEDGRRPPGSTLMPGGLEYPCSSGMAHVVLPLREAKVVTILTPNLGDGQAF